MKIQFDPFLERQFKKDFSGTKLPNNKRVDLLDLIRNKSINDLINSDNDFCKYLIVENNIEDIKQATLPITLDIYPFIRTDYFSRVETELPVLTRFVQLPPNFNLPKAKYLVFILYSRDQLLKEHETKIEDSCPYGDNDFYLNDDVDYGLICVLGTELPEADPYVPITMMRNALGIEEGGNGVKLNKEQYLKSVEFWRNNILIK